MYYEFEGKDMLLMVGSIALMTIGTKKLVTTAFDLISENGKLKRENKDLKAELEVLNVHHN